MTPVRPLAFPEFVALLAMLFATVAFSIDAMLPALTEIAADLSPEAVNRAQLVITTFALGLGLGTLVTGPMSDSFGRKSVVAWGIGLYCVASLVAARAQSLEVLLAARFVQGLGASAARVVTLAMVRDLYQGRVMARVTSIVMTIFILVPAIAPTIGALILLMADWRAIFLACVVFGTLSGGWLLLRQPETLPPERRRPLRPATLWAALREVLGNRLVRTYIVVMALGFGQMFIFLSTAPQAFADVYDRGAQMPYWLGGVALVAGSSGILNAVLVVRLGMRRLATWAFAAQSGAALTFLAVLVLADLPQNGEFAAFIMFLCAAFFMIGLTFGNLNALALEPLGHIAGMASAVVGSLSTFGAAAIAIPVGLAYDGSPLPIVAGVILCSGAAFVLMLTTRDAPPAAAPTE